VQGSGLWHGSRVRAASLSFTVSLLCACPSKPDTTVEPEPEPSVVEPEPIADAPVPSASLRLGGPGEPRQLELGKGLELLSCQWDRAAERGDYVWIRMATSAEAKGDAGPHLDLDVCRLGGEGDWTLMPPGQHGSHCRAEPGFAIWWHEGEAAFVSPVAGKTADTPCTLALVREADDWLSGEFACDPLYSVTDASVGPGVIAGSFRCPLEPMPPPPPK
jgi:hypothetical protein